jgi:hypothetical protein
VSLMAPFALLGIFNSIFHIADGYRHIYMEEVHANSVTRFENSQFVPISI